MKFRLDPEQQKVAQKYIAQADRAVLRYTNPTAFDLFEGYRQAHPRLSPAAKCGSPLTGTRPEYAAEDAVTPRDGMVPPSSSSAAGVSLARGRGRSSQPSSGHALNSTHKK